MTFGREAAIDDLNAAAANLESALLRRVVEPAARHIAIAGLRSILATAILLSIKRPAP